MLTSLAAGNRIEAFAKAVRASGNKQLKQLVIWLRELNIYRNLVAHSTIGLDWEPGDLERTARWEVHHVTRRGNKQTAVDLEEVEAIARRADLCHTWLVLVASDIAASPNRQPDSSTDWRDRLRTDVESNGVIKVSDAFLNELPTRER